MYTSIYLCSISIWVLPIFIIFLNFRIRQICKALEAIWEFSGVMENYLDEKGKLKGGGEKLFMQRGKNEFPAKRNKEKSLFSPAGVKSRMFPRKIFPCRMQQPLPPLSAKCTQPTPPHPTTVAAPRRPRRGGRKIILYIHCIAAHLLCFFCGHTSYVRDSARLIFSSLEYDTLFCLSFVFLPLLAETDSTR